MGWSRYSMLSARSFAYLHGGSLIARLPDCGRGRRIQRRLHHSADLCLLYENGFIIRLRDEICTLLGARWGVSAFPERGGYMMPNKGARICWMSIHYFLLSSDLKGHLLFTTSGKQQAFRSLRT